MTREHETEIDLDNGAAQHAGQPVLQSSESAYDRLTSYGFARRYVRGKVVVDIGREEAGYGSRLLAETAESVLGLVGSPEALDLASAVHSSPNLSYQRVDLPRLPLPEDSFDVVVAFGMVEGLERPEDLLKEIKRVLKEDGLLVVSALDKRIDANDRDGGGANGRRGMYVPEFRELLARHFGRVQLYRQGAVAGGFIFPASEGATGVSVESARFSLADPHFGAEPPVTRSVIAVCSDTEAPGQEEERPYLLLDRDRRVFDECEERTEDVELLRGEIQQMQETEVQAFVDAIKVRYDLLQDLPRYLPYVQRLILERLIHRRNIIYGNVYAVRKKGVKGMARGVVRRSSALYRQLQTRNKSSD